MRYTVNENGCWIFTGPLGKDGYGKVSLKNITFTAHRLMAHVAIQPIVNRTQVVAHKCDTPACINPEHLFVTTALGNSQDRDFKKRGFCGEKHHLAKLKEFDVLTIRALSKEGLRICEIAKQYPNMKYGSLRSIIKRLCWKHI